MSGLLEIKDLRTHFRTDDGIVKAVDGVSLSLSPGEVVGIVGESGSGKSVTALSVLGLIPQPPGFFPGGEIVFEGTNLLGADRKTLQRVRGNRISMIFQDPMTSLNPFLTVERQLTEVLETHEGLDRAAALERALDMLSMVGIPSPAERIRDYPHQFSGGMRQRVMIAMALMCQPSVLIADEPTTALDVTIQAQILDLIVGLNKELQTAVILITHDLGVVAGLTDRIAVMYAGRIVEQASTEELFANPRHPYTRGLLASVPRLDEGSSHALETIGGLPPDLSNLPSGCPFHPRCIDATQNCRETYPDVVEFSPTRWTACWNPVSESSS